MILSDPEPGVSHTLSPALSLSNVYSQEKMENVTFSERLYSSIEVKRMNLCIGLVLYLDVA